MLPVFFEEFNTFMLGRGDLALYSILEEFGENQARFFKYIGRNQKRSIIATGILNSLYSS